MEEEPVIQPRIILLGVENRAGSGSHLQSYLESTREYESIVEVTGDDYDIINGTQLELFSLLHRHRARGRTTIIVNVNCTGFQSDLKSMLDDYAKLFGVKLINPSTFLNDRRSPEGCRDLSEGSQSSSPSDTASIIHQMIQCKIRSSSDRGSKIDPEIAL
jgi:hypothetical protein